MQATIVTVSPGLYEVSLGFYVATGAQRMRRAPPVIQVLVNGEVALTAVNNPNAIINPGAGGAGTGAPGYSYGGAVSPSGKPGQGGPDRATSTTGLVSSPVTGMTAWDVLLLPAKAKLAVTYAGEERGEGFLGLRKR